MAEPTIPNEPAEIASFLCRNQPLCEQSLYLDLGDCRLGVRSNSVALIEALSAYFCHVVCNPPVAVDLGVIAIDCPEPELDVEFSEWLREPGKTEPKDAYVDLAGARLIRKVRTGMVFLQSETYRIAAGPCLRHPNQVINFINSQYMTWLQHRGWMICHAAALTRGGNGLAIAGFSGGGKSTLLLHLLEDQEVCYITNDRLFIRPQAGGTLACVGIPKQPRINPGTLLHNPRLSRLIPASRRHALLSLPPDQLWELEEKYDVHVEQIYGEGRIVSGAPLNAFLVLNWRRDSMAETALRKVSSERRRDMLGAIMKTPGPFYQYPDGRFLENGLRLDEQAYITALETVPLYEACGRVDFSAMTRYCLDSLLA